VHTPIAGKTLLGVGTASGFLTFEAEKRGAQVTNFDVPSGDTANIDSLTCNRATWSAGWGHRATGRDCRGRIRRVPRR
jgi:2-polyprenyl-3-methyl-5-hydroxy-6-metoxy-1,4-benzoquinol methylase